MFSRTSHLFRPSTGLGPPLHWLWWLHRPNLRPNKTGSTMWSNTTAVANTITAPSDPVGSWLSSNISALPTPIDPNSCILHMSPVYYVWVPNPTAPPVGTKFVYVTANHSATSTSITCDQDAYFSQKDWRYAVDMGTDCSFTGAMPNIKYDEDKIWTSNTVTFPGPTTELSIGNMFYLKWYWPTSDGWWSTHLSTAKVYTEKDWNLTGAIYAKMPSLPKYYPEIADVLRNCTNLLWETAPNSLTYANFLTQTITVPAAAAGGHLTVPNVVPTSTPRLAAPVITPAPSLPRITAAPGFATTLRPNLVEPAAVPVVNAVNNLGEIASERVNDAAASDSGDPLANHAAGDPAAAVAGNAVDILVNSEHFSTVTDLVLPGGFTARPDSSPVTVRDRVVSLDGLGMVHIAPVSMTLPGDAELDTTSPVNSRMGQTRSVVIPLSEIARIGSMNALGVYIPVSIERHVTQPGHSGDGGASTGQQGGVGSLELAVSNIGRWIASGLGYSGTSSLEDGAAVKKGSNSPSSSGATPGSPASTNDVPGQNGPTGIPFTGEAQRYSSTPWMSALLASVLAAFAMIA
ncbi:hypothetical protein BDZ85DRAFT_249592 [Elsinoe ampelina]|uniref:Uncharacterized protein n=1 Tax=Elsinoe ampelina TaxID=302913 RepID=A0A6A6GDC9_9PEZI|nr:hypothetical protein BDZ85DRAFT_249592 [Elsinoe ampelina]